MHRSTARLVVPGTFLFTSYVFPPSQCFNPSQRLDYVARNSLLPYLDAFAVEYAFTAVAGLFCQGGKIDGRLLKFCQSHATQLSGTAKCDLAKFKQPAVTFCLVKIIRPRQ